MFGTEYFHGSNTAPGDSRTQNGRRAIRDLRRLPFEELTRLLRSAQWSRLLRLLTSAGLIAVLLAVCKHFPYLNRATIALLTVLGIAAIARTWSWADELAAAVIGVAGFDYYFLPSTGFNPKTPDNWVALCVFLTTATLTGQLAARAKRRQIKGIERQHDMEKLYQLVNAMLDSAGPEAGVAALADKLLSIFEADGVALYATHSGQVVRAGPNASSISDETLRRAVRIDLPMADLGSMLSVLPIRHGGELAGSIAISGAKLSPSLLDGVAGRIGMGLAKLYAIERTTEAEIVRRSEELKSAVLDSLTHEIRDPLNSIKIAATTLLSLTSVSDFKQREMLTIIKEEVDRMDGVIDQTAQLARIDADKLSLKKETQDLAELIPLAIQEIGAPLGRNRIHLSIPDFLPVVECDKAMIKQALKLLLGNALKYTPRDSPIFVAAKFSGADVVIEVVDRGPGVGDDERDLIFRKFYRGRAARDGTSGTGLGLASAKCIVEAHGGEIWVTSANAGGAAFHLSLPVARVNERVGAR